MNNRPSASLKPVAAQLAALLESGSSDYALMEKLLAQLPQHLAEATGAPQQTLDTRSVGIWKAAEQNGQVTFRRNPSKENEWHCWANVDEIKPKGNKKRVLLLGESAARGYLYDPHYNVAMEMQAVLNKLQLAPGTEVIDLARTSLKILDLLDLAFSSVQLQPDAVVIFAGNNWVFSGIEQAHDFNALQEIYRERSFAGVQEFLESELKKIVSWAITQLANIYMNIPIVFVVPEFNLKDWVSSDAEQVLPRSNKIEQWLNAKKESAKLLAKKDWQAAATAAQSMIAADPSNPLGYERLAACYIETGNTEAARVQLSAARDTVIFGRVANAMPRCTTAVRDAILQQGRACGMKLVDMPTIFAAECNGALPDRTLFLDNCHMTIKGIQLTVKHATSALVKALRGAKLPVIPGSGIEVDAHVKAVAHFSAALYNAHHGQPKEIILHHCRQALSLSAAISNIMMRYIDFSTRSAPSVLCKTFRDMIGTNEMAQYGSSALSHPRNGKLLDAALVDTITDALAAAGHDIKESVKEARIREHAVRHEEVDLLESFYSRTHYDEFSVDQGAAFLQARSTVTRFQFVSTALNDLAVTICYRTPVASNGVISISLNNNSILELPAATTWATHTLNLEKELLQRGVNELEIEWPYQVAQAPIVRHADADSFLNGMFPVIGEIYTLSIAEGPGQAGSLQTAAFLTEIVEI